MTVMFFLKPRYKNQFGGYWSDEEEDTEREDIKEHIRDIVRRALYERDGKPDVVKAVNQVNLGSASLIPLRYEYHNVVEASRYLEQLDAEVKAKEEALSALSKKQAELEYAILKIQAELESDEFMLLCLLQ